MNSIILENVENYNHCSDRDLRTHLIESGHRMICAAVGGFRREKKLSQFTANNSNIRCQARWTWYSVGSSARWASTGWQVSLRATRRHPGRVQLFAGCWSGNGSQSLPFITWSHLQPRDYRFHVPHGVVWIAGQGRRRKRIDNRLGVSTNTEYILYTSTSPSASIQSQKIPR